MALSGLRKGDEIVLTVRLNKEILADVLIVIQGDNMAEAQLYIDGDEDLLKAKEAVAAALHTIEYKLELPHLREMVARRIAELKRFDEEAEGIPPYPDDLNDIPF